MKQFSLISAEKSKQEGLLFAIYLAGELNKVRRHHSLEEIVKLLSVQQVITVMWRAMICFGDICASCKWNTCPAWVYKSHAKLIYYKQELFRIKLWEKMSNVLAAFSSSWVLGCKVEGGQRYLFFMCFGAGQPAQLCTCSHEEYWHGDFAPLGVWGDKAVDRFLLHL